MAHVVRSRPEQGLELAVRSGGHSAAATRRCAYGVVLDLRSLDSLEIDVGPPVVWAGAGLTAVALSTAAAEHGLAIGFGDTGRWGSAGITLGGGSATWCEHGLTVDDLLAAEVVTRGR